jgi:hypothetical protein
MVAVYYRGENYITKLKSSPSVFQANFNSTVEYETLIIDWSRRLHILWQPHIQTIVCCWIW